MVLIWHFLYFGLLVSVYGKNINIKIDSDDVLKLVNGFMSSDTFRRFADQIVQRTAIKYGGYNNPYHPEDDLVNNFDGNIDKENAKFEKSVFKTKQNTNIKENVRAESDIEKENNNFVPSAEDKSEDKLTDNASDIVNNTLSKETTQANKKAIAAIKITSNSPKEQQEIQSKVTNSLPRRYVLKSSN